MPSDSSRKPGAAEIATILKREIIDQKRLYNDRLPPERQLAEEYGVARGTIREALNRLEQDGYVDIRRGSGTYVAHVPDQTRSALEHATPLELIDARFALEPHICRLAVLHARRDDIEGLEALCQHMETNISDPVVFADADTEFHRALANSTRNGLLIYVIGQITAVRAQEEWTRMRQLTLNEEIIRTYCQQHRNIVSAIRNREPEEAANLMKEHLETARLSLTRAAAT